MLSMIQVFILIIIDLVVTTILFILMTNLVGIKLITTFYDEFESV